jgi:hypothetical protein
MMLLATGFLLGVVFMKFLEMISSNFQEDEEAQRVVYEKGYDAGYIVGRQDEYEL